MAANLQSLDIELLSVRKIIPFQYGYTPYGPDIILVTDTNGELKGITLNDYFSTFGILQPSSIAPYLQDALISTTYAVTYSSISTIAYVTNSSIVQYLLPSTTQFLYSTVLSTTISNTQRVDANLSTLSSYILYNNTNRGTSSLSTSLALLSNLTTTGLSTLSTTIGQNTISTLCTINLTLINGFLANNTGFGLSTLSTSMSLNFSSMSTILSREPVGVNGICSLSTVVYTYISSVSAGPGLSTLSTLVFRRFEATNSSSGLSSLSTTVSLGISTFSTSIGRNITGGQALSSFSAGIASNIFVLGAWQGTSTLSTNMSYFFSSFSTGIGSYPPAIEGLCSLVNVVSLGLSTISSGEGLSSLSSFIGPSIGSIDSSLGLSSLSTSLSYGLSSVNSSRGLSSLSTSLSQGLSSVNLSFGLSSISTSLSQGLSSVAGGPGISSLSTNVAAGFLLSGSGLGLSSISSYLGTLSTIDLEYSGFFDFINSDRPLHRFTDKPALGLNCYPDAAATLDVNGMSRFRNTVYLTDTQMVINRPYNQGARAELDVSGSIISDNLYVNEMGIFGTSVTSQVFLTPSDNRLKKNINIIEDALSTIQKIRGVSFNWIEGGRPDIGCIAQEIQEVVPLMVKESNNHLVVAYEKLIPLLLESIKELNARVVLLEKKTDGL
jgi:hypothetical protein